MPTQPTDLAGRVVHLTGDFREHRFDPNEAIRMFGGTPSDTFSEDVDLLVAGLGTAAERKLAKERGVEVVDMGWLSQLLFHAKVAQSAAAPAPAKKVVHKKASKKKKTLKKKTAVKTSKKPAAKTGRGSRRAIDKALKSDVRGFAKRVIRLAKVLEADPRVELVTLKLGKPLSERARDRVQKKLGYDLDRTFLGYFEACDGVELRWELVDAPSEPDDRSHLVWAGGFTIPKLADLFFEDIGWTFGGDGRPEDMQRVIWDGLSEGEMRNALRIIDRFHPEPDAESWGDGYPTVGLIADARYKKPVVAFCEDHVAAVGLRPMLATTYLELTLATCGSVFPRGGFTQKTKKNQLIDWKAADLRKIRPAAYLDWLLSKKVQGGTRTTKTGTVTKMTKGNRFSPKTWLPR